eukprot:gene41183-50255_t
MGCNFDIQIQALYGAIWVTIARFGTKTRCGGLPLCPPMRELARSRGIMGDYGLQYPCVPSNFDGAAFIMQGNNLPSEEKPSTTAENATVAGKATEEGDEEKETERTNEDDKEEKENTEGKETESTNKVYEEDEDAYNDRCERYNLYYSKEQFQSFVECIQPIHGEWKPSLYQDLMAPVPMWCEMARTALPLTCGEIWMSDEDKDIEDTTNRFSIQQQEYKRLWLEAYAKTVADATNLSLELSTVISHYAMGAKDVRVAIRDDERQAEAIRNGDLSEPTPPRCIVM